MILVQLHAHILSSLQQSTITLIPAVQETQTSCFQIWVIVVAVVCGLLVAFFLILALGLVRIMHPFSLSLFLFPTCYPPPFVLLYSQLACLYCSYYSVFIFCCMYHFRTPRQTSLWLMGHFLFKMKNFIYLSINLLPSFCYHVYLYFPVLFNYPLFSSPQCGFFGRGYYKKKQKEELEKRWRDLQEVDGSLGMRVIPPPGSGMCPDNNQFT